MTRVRGLPPWVVAKATARSGPHSASVVLSSSTPAALLMNASEVKHGFSEGESNGRLTSLGKAEMDPSLGKGRC